MRTPLLPLLLPLLLLLLPLASPFSNSMFYCGFSSSYCGQSVLNDIHPSTSTVILAFANTHPDGHILIDEPNYPAALCQQWRRSGKQIVISVGGQNGNWEYVMASEDSVGRFVESVAAVVSKYRLDGVDLDIEAYRAPPRAIAEMIIKLKKRLNLLGRKLLIVSPEDVAVYQGTTVPNPDVGGQPFNYFVPIINLADQYIDYYQPQAYNNWYDGLPGGSLDYLRDVYLNWRNLQGLSPWAGPLQNFAGVKPEKLRIGLLASSQAGGAAYYAQPNTIEQFKAFLKANNYALKGFMVWDSHWDAMNGFAISQVCAA